MSQLYELRQIGPYINSSAACASLEDACEAYWLRSPHLPPGDRLQIECVTVLPDGGKLTSILSDFEILSPGT